MANHRMGRVNEDVKRELTHILREVKDPRVKECFLSIVRVDVTNDLSYCTIYISTIEGMEATKRAVQGLKSASGYIRRELGNKLSLRHTPELIFKGTDSIEYGADIAKKLNNLNISYDDANSDNTTEGNEESDNGG
jgi:ribosome-binding factor A